MKKIIILFLLYTGNASAQPGCTDPQASNYNSNATSNDGSCVYPTTNLSLTVKTNLKTPELTESSGLLNFNNQLWSHVDNGSTTVYELDSVAPVILDSLVIANTNNQDWEDIASSDSFIYIGDFGNNFGNRMNLHVLRIPSSSLGNVASVLPDTINFSYPDQVSFASALNNHSFDCEAFFFYHDSLHLFTKDWINKWTKHYIIPAVPGTYTATLIDSMDATCLITSADIVNDSLVVLLGYNVSGLGNAFLWMLNDFTSGNFFSGNKRKFALGSLLTVGQVEGVVIRGDNTGLITNELFAGIVQPQLKGFNLNPYLSILTSVKETAEEIHYPGLVNDVLSFKVKSEEQLQMMVFNSAGQNVLQGSILEEGSFYVGNLPDGNYTCTLYNNNKLYDSFSFVKLK